MRGSFLYITFDHHPSSRLIMWLPSFIHAEPTPPTTISTDLPTTTTAISSTDPPASTESTTPQLTKTDKPSLDNSKGEINNIILAGNIIMIIVIIKLQLYA